MVAVVEDELGRRAQYWAKWKCRLQMKIRWLQRTSRKRRGNGQATKLGKKRFSISDFLSFKASSQAECSWTGVLLVKFSLPEDNVFEQVVICKYDQLHDWNT